MAKNSTKILELEMSRELYERLKKRFLERGYSVENYVLLHLRAVDRQKTILHLRDKMSFGKYYGEYVEDVVRMDQGYIAWCLRSDAGTKFGGDVYTLMEALDRDEEEKDDNDDIPY